MTTPLKIQFRDISWPLYPIRKNRGITEDNNVLYIEDDYNEYILDNKNMAGNTLAMRRLNITEIGGINLYKFHDVILDLADLLRYSKNNQFLDKSGKLFQYTKSSKHRKLIYRKILKVEVSDTSTFLSVSGIFRKIILPYIPSKVLSYVGLIVTSGDYIVYEFCSTLKKDTRKKL